MVAGQLGSDVTSLARVEVDAASCGNVPDAAVRTAAAALVANIRGIAEMEARVAECSLCEAPAEINPSEVARS